MGVVVKFFIVESYYSNMSLNDLDKEDDEYDEILSKKKKGKGRAGKAIGKTKKILIILIIGMIIGMFLGHYYIEPLIAEAEGSTCKDCVASKELLTQENDCLYSIIGDATLINSCKSIDLNS